MKRECDFCGSEVEEKYAIVCTGDDITEFCDEKKLIFCSEDCKNKDERVFPVVLIY